MVDREDKEEGMIEREKEEVEKERREREREREITN